MPDDRGYTPCAWCGLRHARRPHPDLAGPICDACNAYLYKYDVLPPPDVIQKRIDRDT